MRLNRFYVSKKGVSIGSKVQLDEKDYSHIRKVLRLRKGDKIIVFNGEREFIAELKIVSEEVIVAKLLEIKNIKPFDSNTLSLYFGLIKAIKIDEIIEKSTELGVDSITPVQFDHSQYKGEEAKNRHERWNRIAESASKQSQRIHFPIINESLLFDDLIQELKNFKHVFIFATEEKVETKFIDPKINLDGDIAVVIGPEGGFSKREIDAFIENNFKFYYLGKTILRSETAVISSISIINFLTSSSL